MYGIAILDSGNYALRLCSILERKGYVFEVVPTPCHIAKDGCGYCLRFPLEFKDIVLQEALLNNLVIREMYKVEPQMFKNNYVKIY
ncbi:MAG: DUF3343 domain-containing protein [Acetivibrionales bacterium]|jgi:hypothetical protein|nr:DUF3343 domain-containing protein [Bacillota bacterium]NLP08604.1 DUF3343 domain-containing protein [Clostridiaceae bacterium]HOA54827.1 DUF3343 domain-containing protein [Clostridiales bacterium]HQD31132.1 DUF3343 domain-containing protein [Clostridiales bacterium]